MGDIYISGNGRRNQDTQDIPITPRRVNVNDLGAQNRNAQQVPPQGRDASLSRDSNMIRAANSADQIPIISPAESERRAAE